MALEVLRRAVALMPEHDLIWIAHDGAEAVQKCAWKKPDLLLMDLLMPGMNGVEATRRIMAETPCAILVVTFSTAANLSMVYEAMGHGALDAINKPELDAHGGMEGAEPLLRKIRTISRLLGYRDVGAPSEQTPAEPHPATEPNAFPFVIAIGASTGGPQALVQVLSRFPQNMPSAVLLAQHVERDFAGGLAEWLGKSTPLPVRLAAEGDAPTPGVVFLAATNDHLVVGPDRRLHYTWHPRDYHYRPSVDELFHSLARHWPTKGAAALLTGMGDDGARGLLALRKAGWRTIAQDEVGCVVYGMPKAAARLGAADRILPIERIGSELSESVP